MSCVEVELHAGVVRVLRSCRLKSVVGKLTPLAYAELGNQEETVADHDIVDEGRNEVFKQIQFIDELYDWLGDQLTVLV